MASSKKVVLISGANTGLGFEIVKALAKSSTSYEIIVGSRSSSKGQDAIKEIQSIVPNTSSTFSTEALDLESDESLEKVINNVQSKFGRLDALVNNGGGNFEREISSGKVTRREIVNKSWNINVAGTEILTQLAAPLLLKSSDPRLIFITSGTASCAETDADLYPVENDPALKRINMSPPAGWPKDAGPNPTTYYRSSKTGLNMLMRQWYRILLNDGVKVWAVAPGFLATGLAGIGTEKLKQMGAIEPHIGGEFVRDVIEGKRDHHVGKIVRNHGKIQDW